MIAESGRKRAYFVHPPGPGDAGREHDPPAPGTGFLVL